MERTKDDVIRILQKEGYSVSDTDGVLMFHVTREEYQSARMYRTIKKRLAELDYVNSWGMRPDKDGVNANG